MPVAGHCATDQGPAAPAGICWKSFMRSSQHEVGAMRTRQPSFKGASLARGGCEERTTSLAGHGGSKLALTRRMPLTSRSMPNNGGGWLAWPTIWVAGTWPTGSGCSLRSAACRLGPARLPQQRRWTMAAAWGCWLPEAGQGWNALPDLSPENSGRWPAWQTAT